MGAASCASLDALGDLRQRARARWLGRGACHAGRLGLTPNKAQAARHHPFPVLCFWFAWGGRGWHRRPVHVAPCGGLAPRVLESTPVPLCAKPWAPRPAAEHRAAAAASCEGKRRASHL